MRNGFATIISDERPPLKIKILQTQTLMERLGGLLVLPKLEAGQGLWLTPCNAVHTIAMKYELDLIYINKRKEVCAVVTHLKPWRMSLCLKANAVLELTAGSIDLYNIKVGDRLKWQD